MSHPRPRILIVKLSAIGDVVHTLPALNALRRHFPKAHITWLVEAAAAEILKGHSALDRVIVSRRKQWAQGFKTGDRCEQLNQIRHFIANLRDTEYDMIFDFQAALKGAMLIALARGKRKIGFGPGMHHQEHSYLVLNKKMPMVSMDIHALKRGLLLLKAVGISADNIEYRLPISPGDRLKVAQLLKQGKSDPQHLAMAINPMAKWETKLWPADRFAELADRLVERYRASVYFTGSAVDRRIIDRIIRGMRHGAVNLAGRTSLTELAALYEQMACIVSTDTGPMHIACAVERPVVALFGPTAEWRTGPFGPNHTIVTSTEACRPCFKRTCSNTKCMRAITVDQVMHDLSTILVT